jgi:hypothetical protein
MLQHGDAVRREQIAQAVTPTGLVGFGQADHQFGDRRRRFGAERLQHRSRLHQRLAGAAGLGDGDEAGGGERQPRQEQAEGLRIEIVHEMNARLAAQEADARNRVAGELRQSLAAETGSAGAKKDDVGGAGTQPLGRCERRGEVVLAFGKTEQRQPAVLMPRTQPIQGGCRARQCRFKIGLCDTMRPDPFGSRAGDRLLEAHRGLPAGPVLTRAA